MLVPNIAARMKKRLALAGFRVNTRLSSFFSQRTRNTSESQVLFLGFAAVRLGKNMIDVKSSFLPDLGKLTIFATVPSPAYDKAAQRG